MNRAVLLVLCAVPFLVSKTYGGDISPSFRISVYAPVQSDSPVRIVGLHYERGLIRLALANESERAVASVAIAGIEIAPPGCGSEPRKRVRVGGTPEPLEIPPHGTVLTPGQGYPPSFPAVVLMTNARRLEAAALQFQVVVMGVDFADGTRWRSQERLPRTPFDSSIVEADAGRCPNAAAIVKALSAIDHVEFGQTNERPSDEQDEGTKALPHLLFQCSLEGVKAVCPVS
jgi:hypothetical protein